MSMGFRIVILLFHYLQIYLSESIKSAKIFWMKLKEDSMCFCGAKTPQSHL